MSEPQRLGEILPSVMDEIRERMESKTSPEPTLFVQDEHKARVLSAVGGFMMSANKKRPRRKKMAVV